MGKSFLRIAAATVIGIFLGWWLFAGACAIETHGSSGGCTGEDRDLLIWIFLLSGTAVCWYLIGRLPWFRRPTKTMSQLRLAAAFFGNGIASIAIIVFVGILASLFRGDYIPAGTPWQSMVAQGVMVNGNLHPPMVVHCPIVSGFMSEGRHCEGAFVDHRGRKISWTEVQKKIDNRIVGIPALAPWSCDASQYGSCNPPPRREAPYDMPYEFHILTISPIVVLAVPVAGIRYADCGYVDRSGCMYSRSSHSPLLFRHEIKIAPGSFIFTVEDPIETRPIADGATAFEFQLPDSKLGLIADHGYWKPYRVDNAKR